MVKGKLEASEPYLLTHQSLTVKMIQALQYPLCIMWGKSHVINDDFQHLLFNT